MKYLIADNRRGFLFHKGRFEKVLIPGEYRFSSWKHYSVQQVNADGDAKRKDVPLHILLEDEAYRKSTLVIRKQEGKITMLKENGIPVQVIDEIETVLWNTDGRYSLEIIPCDQPEIPKDFPKSWLGIIPRSLYTRFTIPAGEIGFLYYDGKLESTLETGVYYFWNGIYEITCKTVDLKKQQMEIAGQEILTADRVSIRLNVLTNYHIKQPEFFVEKIKNPDTQIYSLVQMTARALVGRKRFDEILEEKEILSEELLAQLKKRESELGIAFDSAGIKDIILPGDIREIMNRVLVAEKNAQANVISRREEVASTRSLLNTAKLMEDNPTLYKLKELEYLEKICDKVGSISVSGGDLLGQLREIVGGSH